MFASASGPTMKRPCSTVQATFAVELLDASGMWGWSRIRLVP